jgi:hypothetical protein
MSNRLAEIGCFPDSPLAVVKAALCRHADAQAELIRAEYCTPGTGMMHVYVLKGMEGGPRDR